MSVESDFLWLRITYLRGLPAIGEGWLGAAGHTTAGLPPAAEVCEQAIRLLEELVAAGLRLSSKNLCLGPLPEGGVGLEFRGAQGRAVLALNNQAAAEVALEEAAKGVWAEYKLEPLAAIALVKDHLLTE